jgi:predicted CopG family antitoxin
MEVDMAVKTITIDLEAYERLAAAKGENESFSRVIKRLVPGKRSSAADLLVNLPRAALSSETLDRVDEILEDRERHFPGEFLKDGEKE